MNREIFTELENRRHEVHKVDLESRSRNLGHFRDYWLHMTILSSAIALGVLPLLNEDSSIISSVALAELGLALIILVCVTAILYIQNVLMRERDLLSEQREFHEDIFSMQEGILRKAKKDAKGEEFLRELFDRTKSFSSSVEQGILIKHLLTRNSRVPVRDRYFNHFITYGFTLGVLFVALSFIWKI